jgi:nucleotide-binding universal stress UspA family protein
MTVIAWIVEATWPACVEATRLHAPADADIVTELDPAGLAHGSYAGLLGRGHTEFDPGVQVEQMESRAAAQLLERAAARLARPCTKVDKIGRIDSEVVAAAQGAELLVLARDGDTSHLGPRSLSPASRFIVDHAPCPLLLVWPASRPKAADIPPHPPAPRP